MPNIAARDRVFDIYADRTPIILQVADGDTARWSFIPDPPAVTLLGNGAYKIVNFQTGTVLDVANTVNRPGTHTLNIVYSPATADYFPFIVSSWPGIKGRRPPQGRM